VCHLSANTIEHNSRANLAVLDRSSPHAENNVIQEGAGRGIVITGMATGVYRHNRVSNHRLAGIYVGGKAEPNLESNVVADSGASGIVVEDTAKGVFTGNSIFGNECAAVAVQGNAQPLLHRNVVIHDGRGGIWLGEQAGGIFTENCVQDCESGWRIGSGVTAKIDQTTTQSLDRLVAMMERNTSPMQQKLVIVRNPDEDAGDSIALGVARAPLPLLAVKPFGGAPAAQPFSKLEVTATTQTGANLSNMLSSSVPAGGTACVSG